MSKRKLCTALGLWVAIIPFLGLPGDWKQWVITISGLLIAAISYIHVKKIYPDQTI